MEGDANLRNVKQRVAQHWVPVSAPQETSAFVSANCAQREATFLFLGDSLSFIKNWLET